MPRQLRIISEQCIGCKSCELGCSLANEGEFNPNKSRITMVSFMEGRYRLPYNVPLTCKQCFDAPCLNVCPVDAISFLKNELKTVVVDRERCMGCGKCVVACPFGAMLFDREGKKAFKCELCGGEPACASICPTGAIIFIHQRPFYSKEAALEIEGFSILSKRRRENLRQPKTEK
jgi:carbon-monoxide dehydrogenase iron sulfur subunit